MADVGRMVLVAGLVLAAVGVLLIVGGQLGLGRLPGDLRFGRGNVRIFVPLATSLVLSLILTLALNLFLRR
jgi:hypothetical protein